MDELARLRKRVDQQEHSLAVMAEAISALRDGSQALREENRELRLELQAAQRSSATGKSAARADRQRVLGPAAPHLTGHEVPPTFARGLAIAILYAAVFLIAGLLSSVDYDAISDSTSNVVGFVVIPVGLGILATLALSARWGWWPAIFRDEALLSRPRWARLIPVLIALSIAASLIAAPWGDWTVGLVVLILLGTLMVGSRRSSSFAATCSSGCERGSRRRARGSRRLRCSDSSTGSTS